MSHDWPVAMSHDWPVAPLTDSLGVGPILVGHFRAGREPIPRVPNTLRHKCVPTGTRSGSGAHLVGAP